MHAHRRPYEHGSLVSSCQLKCYPYPWYEVRHLKCPNLNEITYDARPTRSYPSHRAGSCAQFSERLEKAGKQLRLVYCNCKFQLADNGTDLKFEAARDMVPEASQGLREALPEVWIALRERKGGRRCE